jgi:hypothetical protein
MRSTRMSAAIRAVLSSLALLVLAIALSAAPAAARPFAPVQGGFQPNAPEVPEHVPGRVLGARLPCAQHVFAASPAGTR